MAIIASIQEKPSTSPWYDLMVFLLNYLPVKLLGWMSGEKSEDSDIPTPLLVKVVPVAIIALSSASLANFVAQSLSHHNEGTTIQTISSVLMGIGLATFVPLMSFSAIRAKNPAQKKIAWVIAGTAAITSGAIQFAIYAPSKEIVDLRSFMAWAEAVAFGFGVPLSEVAMAWVEASMMTQLEKDREESALAKVEKAKADLAAEEKRKEDQHREDEEQAEREAQRLHDQRLREIELDTLRVEAQAKAEAAQRLAETNAEIALIAAKANADSKRIKASSTAPKGAAVEPKIDKKKVGTGVGTEVGTSANADVEDRRDAILAYLAGNSGIGGTQGIADALGVSARTVGRLMQELEKNEKCRPLPTERGKEKKWEVIHS